MRYFFILGKTPTLSIAEIISVLDKWQINYSFLELSGEVTLIDTDNVLAIDRLMAILGGTIKIGKILDEVGLEEDESRFYQIFSAKNLLQKYLIKNKGKLHLGLSIYSAGGEDKYLNILFGKLKYLNMMIKNNFQEAGKRVGFVRIKDRFLSSVSVYKNQLLTKGVEIVLITTRKGILVGKTAAVQEFESFSFRDYGRPCRDKRSGIMPPKLARMMINLAEIDEKKTLLDPFCGSGTILQEAILLGYKNIIGGDISMRAIADTKRNIDWLFRNYPNLNKSSYNIELIETNVSEISKKIENNSIAAIVTEPYLGPPFYRKLNTIQTQNILNSLKDLYLRAFHEFNKILKKDGKIVIIFPCFEIDGKYYSLDIISQIGQIGFKQEDLIPEKIGHLPIMKKTWRKTIIYGGKEHFVKREILSFSKI